MSRIIALSGISGAGKSKIGTEISKILSAVYIDQDSYFLYNIPKVELSNNYIIKNYDSDEAIDIVKFNDAIRSNKNNIVIVVGFSLRTTMFDNDNIPNIHFHLNIPKELSLLSRLNTKPFSEERKNNEILVFNEYVYPYYQETLKLSQIDHYIECYDNIKGERRNVNDIVFDIINKL